MIKLWILLASLIACSCRENTRNVSEEQAGVTVQEKTATVSAADTEGIYMRAVIDGENWVATKMIPDYSVGSSFRSIHGETDDYSISFTVYKPAAGVKRELNEEYAISLMTHDGFYGGRSGSVEIIMADEYWIEGRFAFTATSTTTDKTIRVTNGFFRVATNDPHKSPE